MSQRQRTTDIPLIPREVLFGNPDKAMPKVSHDGKHLAFLAPLAGVLDAFGGYDKRPYNGTSEIIFVARSRRQPPGLSTGYGRSRRGMEGR